MAIPSDSTNPKKQIGANSRKPTQTPAENTQKGKVAGKGKEAKGEFVEQTERRDRVPIKRIELNSTKYWYRTKTK